jgi:hypothetical protein
MNADSMSSNAWVALPSTSDNLVEVFQLLAEPRQGLRLVAMLSALRACDDSNACGDVNETYGALCLVLVLAAWPTRPECLDAALCQEAFVVRGDGNRSISHRHVLAVPLVDGSSYGTSSAL